MTRLTPSRLFVVTALVGGFILVAVTPPFQVPDEPAHFFRAYSVSEGRLLVRTVKGMPGEELPVSLHRLMELVVADVKFHPERRLPPGTWREGWSIRLEPEQTAYLHFPTSAQYSAVPYLPQAAGIAVGRLVGARPLALMYVARITNLLAAVVLIVLAIHLLPAYRWLATLIALMPMAMFLRSSVSADAPVTAIALLFTAVIAKLAFGTDTSWSWPDLVILIVSATALSLTKPIYFPLVLMVAAIPTHRLPPERRRMLVLGVLGLTLIAVTLALVIARPSINKVAYDAETRIDEVLERPLHVAGAILADLMVHAPRFAAQFIGKLGWLDTRLPPAMILAYFAALLAVAALDTDASATVKPWQRLVVASAVAGSIGALGIAMYLYLGKMDGIQGRYFHPIALAAAWACYSRRFRRPGVDRWIGPGVAVVTVTSLVITISVIVDRYYG